MWKQGSRCLEPTWKVTGGTQLEVSWTKVSLNYGTLRKGIPWVHGTLAEFPSVTRQVRKSHSSTNLSSALFESRPPSGGPRDQTLLRMSPWEHLGIVFGYWAEESRIHVEDMCWGCIVLLEKSVKHCGQEFVASHQCQHQPSTGRTQCIRANSAAFRRTNISVSGPRSPNTLTATRHARPQRAWCPWGDIRPRCGVWR